MKSHYYLLAVILAGAAQAEDIRVSEPITIRIDNSAELDQELTLNASAVPEQWVAAFTTLRQSTSNKIEITLIKDGEILTLENIYKLEKSPAYRDNTGTKNGGLIIAHQRTGQRDYRIIIDPRQIRYIRETDS